MPTNTETLAPPAPAPQAPPKRAPGRPKGGNPTPAEIATAVAATRRFLEQHGGAARFPRLAPAAEGPLPDPAGHTGFRVREAGEEVYWVPRRIWSEEICEWQRPLAMSAALEASGWLIRADAVQRIADRWVRGRRLRVYVVRASILAAAGRGRCGPDFVPTHRVHANESAASSWPRRVELARPRRRRTNRMTKHGNAGSPRPRAPQAK